MNTKPLIGISANFKDDNSMLARQYYESVILAGGAPIIIPVSADNEVLAKIVRTLDGLVMSGGGDINPQYFDEQPIPQLGETVPLRDEYDIKLIQIAHEHQVPILGICRGIQVMNVAFGGSMYQDIAAQHDGFVLKHSQDEPKNITTHSVIIKDNSLLAKIVGTENLDTNTIHHQAVRRVADGFYESAFTRDGICEAIESVYYSEIGVQWHPEHLAANSENHLKIFQWLIKEAQIFNRAKNIHAKNPVIDTHCDTPMYFKYNIDLGKNNDYIWLNPKELGAENENERTAYKPKVDFVKMGEGLVDCVMMAAYLPQGELTAEAHLEATKRAENILQQIHNQVNNNSEIAQIATNPAEILNAKKAGKAAVVPVIENGYAIGEDIKNIEKFYQFGVRYITLCHNGDNLICDSAQKTQNTHNGLSDFGRKVVAEMNRLGIMIDISHAGEKTFWDVVALSTKPIIASHSCAKNLCNHPRNLTDEQIIALAKNGGVCQICIYKDFLTDLPVAAVENLVEHITHVVNLVGIDYAGVGSDFDGGGEILGCLAENEFINITKALIKHNFSDEDIAKILGGNILRVMEKQL